MGGSGSTILFLLAAIFVAWQTYRGWRLGIIRAALRLGALVGSGFVGWYGGLLTAKAVSAALGIPGWTFGVPVGIFLALAVYVALSLVARLCFKRTGHQESTLIRLVFGVGGALIGFAIGIVFVVAGISGVRALGGMAEGRLEAGDRGELIGALSNLNESVRDSKTGSLLTKADPIPDSTYVLLSKFTRVLADPDAIARMVESPELAPVLENPKILALAGDPSVQTAARDKNVLALMTNPKVLEMARDPELSKEIMGIDLQKALDYALEKPSASQEIQSAPR